MGMLVGLIKPPFINRTETAVQKDQNLLVITFTQKEISWKLLKN